MNSKDLTVVLHLNRTVSAFSPAEIIVPPLKVAALWIFGAIAPDQSRWAMWEIFLMYEKRVSLPTHNSKTDPL